MPTTSVKLLCLHCERRPRSTQPRRRKLRLCDRCAAGEGGHPGGLERIRIQALLATAMDQQQLRCTRGISMSRT